MFRSIIFGLTISLSLSTNAALYDRGNGMIYDDVLDITWLQDANYAYTSGYDDDGIMSWDNAKAWADNLVYRGYDDWRLTSARNPVNPDDTGMNKTSSELGHMFYNNLGLSSGSSILENVSFTDALDGDLVSFNNVQSFAYWYEEEISYADVAWVFWTLDGLQFTNYKEEEAGIFSWAVRDGDVSSVPVPAAIWLFGSATVGLIGLKRKK